MTNPWDRAPDETPPAWEAFTTYRDLGPGQRSTAKVAQDLGKTKTLMDGWSARHRWVERARAFDAWVDLRAQEALARRAVERKERQATLGRNLQAVASLPAQELARRIKAGTLDLAAMKATDLVKLQAALTPAAKVGADLENLAADDVTDRTAVRVDPHLERLRRIVEEQAAQVGEQK